MKEKMIVIKGDRKFGNRTGIKRVRRGAGFRLWMAGWSIANIAEICQVSIRGVEYWRKKDMWRDKRSKEIAPTDKSLEEIIALESLRAIGYCESWEGEERVNLASDTKPAPPPLPYRAAVAITTNDLNKLRGERAKEISKASQEIIPRTKREMSDALLNKRVNAQIGQMKGGEENGDM